MNSRKIIVTGHVQGVGFRPFVYRLATRFRLNGSVQNQSGEVVIICHGDTDAIDGFSLALISEAPPLSDPHIKSISETDVVKTDSFSIIPSDQSATPDIHIPPDFFICDDCLQEMNDPQQRRFQYPFTNCTQCGPRYTLINHLPYDRPNTSMAGFQLCDDCRREYETPDDRRFHAQPLACEKCGPQLTFVSADKRIKGNRDSLKACIQALTRGQIVGIKGVGGYHLMCDAHNEDAIQTLRQRKQRPAKPFAVMFPANGKDNLEAVRHYAELTDREAELVNSPQRPVVLVNIKPFDSLHRPDRSCLPQSIAPGLNQLGVFLPYSPLHHLLLNAWQGPLIATSGNISGEPVITDNQQAEQKLATICDAFLQHDRPIVRPADDSVQRVVARKVMTLRSGRGIAPLELELPEKIAEPVLAVGGHLKATVALAWDKRIVVSPHISDLDTRRGLEIFEQVITDLQNLYQTQAQKIVCDAHPGYQSSRWAEQQALPVEKTWHHHAHASVVAGQYPEINHWLMFCWDGVGLGQDNTLWGGETFHGQPGHWQHLAGFKPFYLPGADKAGREPWRSAAALLWETGSQYHPAIEHGELAFQAWHKKINCPQSSAAGRLFDAAASLILNINLVSYEGQGPMQLEAVASDCEDFIALPLLDESRRIDRVDWSAMLPYLMDQSKSVEERAAIFHNSMAQTVIDQALHYSNEYAFDGIGLSGGVFQNKKLVETIIRLAQPHKLNIYLPATIPVNDGGLSYGQIIEFMGIIE
ncbi:MAG: carbamoyltransferase HypF [Gammaproteobacteria bacterium]|nr:carbamoyltransferase HypF [Gammaproteobacteria bacterium]